jgi:hypothetical protein
MSPLLANFFINLLQKQKLINPAAFSFFFFFLFFLFFSREDTRKREEKKRGNGETKKLRGQ